MIEIHFTGSTGKIDDLNWLVIIFFPRKYFCSLSEFCHTFEVEFSKKNCHIGYNLLLKFKMLAFLENCGHFPKVIGNKLK